MVRSELHGSGHLGSRSSHLNAAARRGRRACDPQVREGGSRALPILAGLCQLASVALQSAIRFRAGNQAGGRDLARVRDRAGSSGLAPRVRVSFAPNPFHVVTR
ncbi:hypothetical protein PLANTIT3_70133 [Plantibacter sp. T3]|nr:hypothetical protein PLANTIT3_70133 [Plantibacter sp. T3]